MRQHYKDKNRHSPDLFKTFGHEIEEQQENSEIDDEISQFTLVEDYPIKEGLISNFMNKCNNLGSNLSFTIKQISSTPFKDLYIRQEGLIMLGKSYSKRIDFKRDYNNIIYFSYRRDLEDSMKTKFTSKNSSPKYCTQDTNWGCSIRSSQMLFAHFIQTLYPDFKQRDQVINLFRDHNKAPLSIQNICKEGMDNFDADVGQYWRPLTALLCLGRLTCQDIHSNDDNRQLFEYSSNIDRPMRMVLVNNSILNFNNLEKQFCFSGTDDFEVLSPSSNDDLLMSHYDSFLCPSEKDKNMYYTSFEKKVLLIISGCFGNQKVDKPNFEQICEILENKNCVGMIGGVSREAYYIVGAYKDNFLILDPHLVNKFQPKSEKIPNKSYLPHSEARMVHYSKFNYNISIGFGISNYGDIIDLQELFVDLKSRYEDDFYFSVVEKGQSNSVGAEVLPMSALESFSLAPQTRERSTSFEIMQDPNEPFLKGHNFFVGSDQNLLDSSFMYVNDNSSNQKESWVIPDPIQSSKFEHSSTSMQLITVNI